MVSGGGDKGSSSEDFITNITNSFPRRNELCQRVGTGGDGKRWSVHERLPVCASSLPKKKKKTGRKSLKKGLMKFPEE